MNFSLLPYPAWRELLLEGLLERFFWFQLRQTLFRFCMLFRYNSLILSKEMRSPCLRAPQSILRLKGVQFPSSPPEKFFTLSDFPKRETLFYASPIDLATISVKS